MNALPGVTVVSSFQAAPGQPGGVELILNITRKRFEYGFGFDNAGQSALGRTEVEANVAIDNLFGEGDKTQLVYGMPLEVKRFQYLSLTHIEPLGNDGATVTLSAADLLTHPLHRTRRGRNAYLFGAQLAKPLIETVHTNLVGILGFDTINSDEALVGTTISDERTRSIRVRLRGATDRWFDGVGAFDLGLSRRHRRAGRAARHDRLRPARTTTSCRCASRAISICPGASPRAPRRPGSIRSSGCRAASSSPLAASISARPFRRSR